MSEYANYDDYNDPDEENEYDALNPQKSIVGKIIKKTILYSLRILALAVFVILIWRVFSGNEPKSMQNFLWNEDSVSEYTNDPANFQAYYYKHKDNLSADGKFSASYVYFVPSSGQFQITLRYNDSTIEKLMNDYELSSAPKGEAFVFTLKDHLGNVYTEYEYVSDRKNMYNYRRLVFKGVDMTPLTVDPPSKDAPEDERKAFEKEKEKVLLTLNVYYKDDVLLSKPYGVMPVYDYTHYHEPMNMKKIAGKQPITSEGLTQRMEYSVIEEPSETTEN